MSLTLSVRSVLLLAALLMAVHLKTATAAEAQDPSQPLRGHGDPCGYSRNQSLVCCPGSSRSTLIHSWEECCNGSPLAAEQICCDGALPVTRTSPDQDSCCLNPDSLQGVTFSSRRHYCNFATGDVVRLPSRQRLLTRLRSFRGDASSSSSSSSEESAQEETPSLERMCRSGRDVSPSEGQRWRGEVVGCCGLVSYLASRQSCCAGVLYDRPAADTQCCYDVAYKTGDPSNPCLRLCGGSVFNSENELCCQGTIRPSNSSSDICCGNQRMSTETHMCCGEAVMPLGDSGYQCCGHHVPYVRRYMRCRRTGQLTRKVNRRFHTRCVCGGRLPIWDPQWPVAYLQGARSELLLAEGRVTSLKKGQSGKVHLTLRLSGPAASLPPPAASNSSLCLAGTPLLHLNVDLGQAGTSRRCRGRKLRQYLRDRVLHVYFPLNAFSRGGESGVAVVDVPSVSGEHLMLLEGSVE